MKLVLALKKLLVVLLFSVLPLFTFTQNYIDLVKFSYSATPENKIKDDTLNLNSKTQLIDFGIDLTAPIVLKNKNVFISGVVYEQTNLKTAKTNNLIYTINPKIGYKTNHSENFSSTIILLPKLSSDLKKINGNHFQIGGLALFEKTKTKNFKYKFGAYYNHELFGPFAVPLLGFYYKSENQKFEANFTLPVYAGLNYRLKSWLNSGISFNSFVRSFYIGDVQNQYLVKTSNEIFALLQLHSKTTHLIIEPQVGYSVGRSYRVYDSSDKVDFGFSAFKFGDDRKQLNQDFEDGLIFKVRLLYRFMIENN
ncbi:hypothetical protein FRY74_08635 [Vicingus serpentipes]|uniref:DUF6268 domain-containing protein n=1 Tax=Vicingus serpentipes TaxID=1926625 RepID=A0A5C6RT71_9FLAO|nr:DUF6268 family outer membrane beta-barrel protein [Vicingus serpentipes]TXB65478.1 hypothetical protein FRY74_08635 [Vicingus serpentipes]